MFSEGDLRNSLTSLYKFYFFLNLKYLTVSKEEFFFMIWLRFLYMQTYSSYTCSWSGNKICITFFISCFYKKLTYISASKSELTFTTSYFTLVYPISLLFIYTFKLQWQWKLKKKKTASRIKKSRPELKCYQNYLFFHKF